MRPVLVLVPTFGPMRCRAELSGRPPPLLLSPSVRRVTTVPQREKRAGIETNRPRRLVGEGLAAHGFDGIVRSL